MFRRLTQLVCRVNRSVLIRPPVARRCPRLVSRRVCPTNEIALQTIFLSHRLEDFPSRFGRLALARTAASAARDVIAYVINVNHENMGTLPSKIHFGDRRLIVRKSGVYENFTSNFSIF